jgi:drug/metabolite transporter (DMT)-like permease
VGGGGALRAPTGEETGALAWLVLAVTVVAFLCWFEGLRRLQAERATLLAGLIPVAAAVLAPLAGTGAFGVSQLAGSVLVAIGVSLGLGGAPAPAAASADEPAPAVGERAGDLAGRTRD